ncbi:MAG TPA: RNA 2',3'-cyclic phosphodiesterase [Candidatus Methanoperedenaceae archaeon]|nr:RNA 2',3'-cyclic phosphodiesterase [Candidatus Methanoperedenaceae archaeon]
MIRAFVAVVLLGTLIPEIEKVEARLPKTGLKPVKPAQVHITLKFLGDVKETQVSPISIALSQVACRSFDARVKGVGVFPGSRAPRVVWLGAEGNFEELHAEVERLLEPLGFGKDDRKFVPHATLARIKFLKKEDSLRLGEALSDLSGVDMGTIRVGSISLKKSTLTPGGPVYETLKDVKLRDA